MDFIYTLYEDVVARLIEGESIIVPLAVGIGDLEDELFTLNKTGQAVCRKLEGQCSLAQVTTALAQEYQAARVEIEADILGLVEALSKRRMQIAVDPG